MPGGFVQTPLQTIEHYNRNIKVLGVVRAAVSVARSADLSVFYGFSDPRRIYGRIMDLA